MAMSLSELEALIANGSLYDSVKVALRISSDAYSSEVYELIGTAINDMLTKGVSPNWLGTDIDDMPLLARQAVVFYAKANAGYDNSEADRFQGSYDSTVCTILNSSHNSVYDETEQP